MLICLQLPSSHAVFVLSPGKGGDGIYLLLASFLCALGSIDLLIDKQELIRNKVLKANDLCDSDTMDVCVGRQFESKIFGFRIVFNP